MSVIVKHAADLSSEEKRALLTKLLQEQARKPKVLPASFAQEQLWFLDQLEPGLSAYNIHMAVRLAGRLDQAALEQSLGEIVRRHETLRTTFGVSEGKPVQNIYAADGERSGLLLKVHDLQKVPPAEQAEKVQLLATQEAQQPFDLTHGPLVRATLLRLEGNEHVLLLTTHHSISDGWSMGILYRELGLLYRAFVNGQPSPLPSLSIQYADYAVWQRERLQGETLDALLSYWKEMLGGDLPVLELPGDHVRPAVQSFRGASHIVQFPATLRQRVQNLSRQAGVTMFMTLLAAFKTLLYRYTGQQDVIVGSPIANRNRAEVEGTIGFFMNMLVLRTELSGSLTFRELLSRVQKVASGAYIHSDLPFEILVKELQPQRDLSRSPLFQVMFVLQNTFEQVTELPELKLSVLPVKRGTTHYDLSVHLFETPEGLEGVFEYNTDLFEKETIERLAGHYQTLLEGGVANPERCLADLPLLTEAERQQILVEWNSTQTEYTQDQCIHQLFEARAGQTPDAVAIVFQALHLTYCKLNRRANQLAHYLKARGVQPDCLVGIYMSRSLETMVGMLGILKAGGAYVPLDPAYPEERRVFMVADTRTPVLLTQARWTNRLAGHETQVICLDTDWESIAQESDEEPVSDISPNNLAYVIYTSGSTGQPKGVLVPHRGLPNVVQTMVRTFALTSQDRVLQFSSLSFDASVYDILLALGSGATLCLAHENLLPDLGLSQWLQDVGVTIIPLTASTLAALPSDGLATLRIVISGAEACPAELVARWTKGRRFFNVYGPTEATIWTTVTECNNSNQKPAIGKPISNVRVYILDAHLQPVPVGVVGEMCIGGIGVTRGYLNSPALTAEKFIPHPFGLEPGARLYRTADLARYLPDGNIDFLGRLDHQVKVRGFRIELGEIEMLLGQHPIVRETAVMAREDKFGNKQLVAYVVPQNRQALVTSNLRHFLQEKLPEYMVPSAFVTLDALPLTPNGKVDRRALPSPDTTRPELDGVFTSPRTPMEEVLVALWTQVLDIERVGIHDDFFELGGHSLLATQLVSRIRETFQIELPLRMLFESPTVVGLVEHIEALARSELALSVPPLVPVARKGELPLSFAQQRLWFLNQLEPDSTAYNIPVALRLTGLLDVATLRRSFNEIVRRHEALRTTFKTMDGRPVQIIIPITMVSLPMVDLQGLPEAGREAEARRLAAEEAQRPFDLARGPLLRVTLLQLNEAEHVLILTMHHIISDGWSAGVFIREAAALYGAFINGEPSPLPELPVQYADFAVWQREWLQGKVLAAQLAYWRENLGDTLGVLELPTDRPRPPVQTFRGATQPLALSRELSEALKALSRREGVTLFMMLLAAFKTLLYNCTGQKDITVGSPIANRNWAEIEGLIGFFVNTLVLRTWLEDNLTFRELLNQVREVTIGAYTHQDLPFEKIVEELQLERDLSRTPLFQVFFNMLNFKPDITELPGLKVELLSPFDVGSKFDLTLYIQEQSKCIQFNLLYNADLFEKTTILWLLSYFHALLENIVDNPDQHLFALQLLAEKACRPLYQSNLVHPTNSFVKFTKEEVEQSILDRFEQQVSKYPNKVAVKTKRCELTYSVLNLTARRIAQTILTLCGHGEGRIALLLEQGASLIVGILGILKAGKTYVPLDPTYPKQRQSYMLEDSQASAILTNNSNFHLAQELAKDSCQLINIDDADAVAAGQEVNFPISPDAIAYIIYTSGSTGHPKGTVQTHRNVLHFIMNYTNGLHICPEDRLSLLYSCSFSAAAMDVFAALLNGATLCPFDILREGLTDLANWLIKEEITVYHSVPTVFRHFVSILAPDVEFPKLRLIDLGGESVSRTDVDLYKRHFSSDCILVNGLGATELNVIRQYFIDKQTLITGSNIPVGYEVEDTEILLLDDCGQRVGSNRIGEIAIKSRYLSPGYWRKPDLTQSVFRHDPGGRGERIYYTGDLGRMRSDGCLAHLGRKDFQVKIRGHRVEVAEIETALLELASIREAVVVARDNMPGAPASSHSSEWDEETRPNKRLVAYVVAHQAQEPMVDELRRSLQQKLPNYMIPSVFVKLKALPLTPNGKVDRQALPAPDMARPELEMAFVAPRNPVEEVLAGIWTEVLGLEQVGVHDNFFGLGGHSLLATQVVSYIRDALQVEISLRALFEAPTVAGLAAILLRDPEERVRIEKTAQLLVRVAEFSEDEVEMMLTEKGIFA